MTRQQLDSADFAEFIDVLAKCDSKATVEVHVFDDGWRVGSSHMAITSPSPLP